MLVFFQYSHTHPTNCIHSIEADPANWNIPKDQIPEGVNGGEGGFMPFGVAGTFKWSMVVKPYIFKANTLLLSFQVLWLVRRNVFTVSLALIALLRLEKKPRIHREISHYQL